MHHGGRFGQQIAEQRRGNIRPQANFLGEDAILFGALDQAVEAFLGDAGAAIVGDAAGDVAIAAAHQHVRHRFAKRAASRDRMQVGLALGFGDVDEIGFRQTRRQLEHRPGDGDIVVVGEPRSTLTGALLTGARRFDEFGAGLGLDLFDQQPEHLVEQIDVLVVVAAGAVEKESGNALQRLGAVFHASRAERLFKLRDQREGSAH